MSATKEKRYDILKEEGLFSLVIFPQRDKWKLNLLFGWWIAWTICGIIFIANYINFSNQAKFYRDQFVRCELEIKDIPIKEKTQKLILSDLDRNQKQRMILLVVICFWIYYEYKVGRAYFYRKFGFEKLWMKNGNMYYKRELNKRGKIKKYEIDFVKEFRLTDYNKHDFFQNMSRSFWTLAGESLEFDYHAKVIRFGIQLEEQEAKEICDQLKRALKKFGNIKSAVDSQ